MWTALCWEQAGGTFLREDGDVGDDNECDDDVDHILEVNVTFFNGDVPATTTSRTTLCSQGSSPDNIYLVFFQPFKFHLHFIIRYIYLIS